MRPVAIISYHPWSHVALREPLKVPGLSGFLVPGIARLFEDLGQRTGYVVRGRQFLPQVDEFLENSVHL